jgi:hypothetical protein
MLKQVVHRANGFQGVDVTYWCRVKSNELHVDNAMEMKSYKEAEHFWSNVNET